MHILNIFLKYYYRYLRKNKIKVGFSSLRADRLNDEILDFIKNEGGGILTLAPETANEKIRFSIGKKITDELFFSSVEKAFLNSVSHLRLYFMIGLPNETEDDVREIIDQMLLEGYLIQTDEKYSMFRLGDISLHE